MVLWGAGTCGSLAFCSLTIKCDFGLLVDELPLLRVWLAGAQSINESMPASMIGYLASPASPVVLWGSALLGDN